MKTTRTTASILCTLTLGLGLGCDTEIDQPTNDRADLVDVEEADQEGESLPAPRADGLDLRADAPAAQSIVYSSSYEGLGNPQGLADGDIVMIKNYKRGYVGCFDGEALLDQGPSNIDNYVWEVHVVDIDMDSVVEYQFELIDATGPTNTFLKMDSGDVHCDVITGIGDASSWHKDSHDLVGGGSQYRKEHFQLQNLKEGLCLRGPSTLVVDAMDCDALYWGMAFWVEVIA